MSEEPIDIPDEVPANHGRFEGPATEQDYLEAKRIVDEKKAAQHVAQLQFQERQARVELNKALEAKMDEITGLPYGAYFRQTVNEKLAKLHHNERRRLLPNNALIVNFDGKGLKAFNDRYGHEGGNIMLQHIGAILKSVAREGDEVGRWGESSDEFAGVFFFRDDQIEPEEMKKEIDERLELLTKTAVEDGNIGGLRWSSTFFEPGQDFRSLLSRAEPVEHLNPGNVIEYPPRDVMPNRDDQPTASV
jgi:diguanylate cyclase (GGDEF)-like protein